MILQDLKDAILSHHALALVVTIALYVRRLTAADSKFPISIAPAWQPVVSAAAGLVYGALAAVQNGEPVGTATFDTVVLAGTSGFADMLFMAIFAKWPNGMPPWAKAIVFVFDDVTGQGPPAPPAGPPKAPSAPIAVKGPMLVLLGAMSLGALATGTSGCTPALQKDLPTILPTADCTLRVVIDAFQHLGVLEIVNKEKGVCGLDATQVLAIINENAGKIEQLKDTVAYKQASSGWSPDAK